MMSADEGGPSASRPTPETVSHRSVMVQEAIRFLAPADGHTVLDCTVGFGGHSLAILPHLMPSGHLIGMDCDEAALEQAFHRLAEFQPHVRLLRENFRRLPELLEDREIPQVNGLLADIGISSMHVELPERGFSFQHEGPLDMRMDQRQELTAASLIHRLSERDLALLLQTAGEERFARRIARRIVEVRRQKPIRTTTELARVVSDAVPQQARGGGRRIHPATRTFQALRIAVNDELNALQAFLDALPKALLPGGRAVIITFHSLEDRLVKHAFQRGAREGLYRVLTKKPLPPSDDELRSNARARSAKLRAVERLPDRPQEPGAGKATASEDEA